MFMTTGAFLRGSFVDGVLTGNCYLRPNSEYAFLLRLMDGILESKSTVFDFSKDNLKVMNFIEGKFDVIAKDFERSADKCHKELTTSLFGREKGTIQEYMDITKKIKKLEGNFFGSFALSETVWFYGSFSNGAPNGLGAMIEKNSKVQIGFFENGQLSGLGRVIWPNGVVMDGMIKKATINEEVIIYNQVAHDWTKALFKDNSLYEEISRGSGYPRDIRAALYEDYFNRGYSRRAKVELPHDIFYMGVSQEAIFHLIYGEKWNDKMPNNLQFTFSGETNIEFDSRKDINEIKSENAEKDIVNDVVVHQEKPKESQYQPPPTPSFVDSRTVQGRMVQEVPAADYEETDVQVTKSYPEKITTAHYQKEEMSSSIQRTDSFKVGYAVVSEREEVEDQDIPESDQNFFEKLEGQRQSEEPEQYILRDSDTDQKGCPMSNKKHHSGHKYPTPLFDKYDMLILQRAVNWDHDKTLNSKNKYTRKTTANKNISEETKLNIVRNYVEDYMECFLEKQTIDKLMNGIEAYQVLKAKQ